MVRCIYAGLGTKFVPQKEKLTCTVLHVGYSAEVQIVVL